LEKKKELKRKEKQQRKEERKSGGVSSLDDMIAYVDENGMISSTPPDPDKKKEVNLEDIAIATSKKEDVEVEPLNGVVERFNASKGFGFIKEAESAENYFFHISNAPAEIAEGDTVAFEFERGPKGMNAVRITRL
jgi:cold shock CspA family protein